MLARKIAAVTFAGVIAHRHRAAVNATQLAFALQLHQVAPNGRFRGIQFAAQRLQVDKLLRVE